VISSAASAAGSAASSATSVATSAATSAAGAATGLLSSIIGGLCNGGGPPSSIGGLGGGAGLPGGNLPNGGLPSPGIPRSVLDSSLAAAALAVSLTSITTGVPHPTADAQVAAAILAAASTGHLPSAIPTEATIWTGFQLPVADPNAPHQPCDALNRFFMNGIATNTTEEDDIVEVCVFKDGAYGWHQVQLGALVFPESFPGENGSELVPGQWLEFQYFPNGTTIIQDKPIIFAGTCVLCTVVFDESGKAISFASGNATLTGNATTWQTAIIRGQDSAIVLDYNSAIINAGVTVLNGTTVTQLNATEIRINGELLEPGRKTGVIAGDNIQVVGAIGENQTVSTSASPSYTNIYVGDYSSTEPFYDAVGFSVLSSAVNITDGSGVSCGATVTSPSTMVCSKSGNIVTCNIQLSSYTVPGGLENCQVMCVDFLLDKPHRPAGSTSWIHIAPVFVQLASGTAWRPPGVNYVPCTDEEYYDAHMYYEFSTQRMCVMRERISCLSSVLATQFIEVTASWRAEFP
jgi:hypothetical protein